MLRGARRVRFQTIFTKARTSESESESEVTLARTPRSADDEAGEMSGTSSAGTSSLLSLGKQRALARRARETPLASLSSPETIAERLLTAVVAVAVRVEGSGEGTALAELVRHYGTADALLEHLIDPAMVAEVVGHASTLLKERVRLKSSKSGGGGGGRSEGGAGEDRRPAAGGKGEDGEDGGCEGKDTASSSGEGISPFELRVAILGGESAGTADDSCPSIGPRDTPGVTGPSIGPDTPGVMGGVDGVPWSAAFGKPNYALRKRPGRVVKLVPVVEDTKGMERSKDGSIILHDQTMLRDLLYACSPRLGKYLEVGFWLNITLFVISATVAIPALPFAILKFTNTTDVLFGPRVANASSAAASALNISNITSDHNGPPWWVGG